MSDLQRVLLEEDMQEWFGCMLLVGFVLENLEFEPCTYGAARRVVLVIDLQVES